MAADQEKVLSIKEGSLSYMVCGNHVVIKRFRGIGTLVDIPELIDNLPVKKIERKTFLSCKTVREIMIPDTVEEIGDWAFAHAENLRKITIPKKEMQFGKELFLGCVRLKRIVLNTLEDEMIQNEKSGIDRMLAIAVTALHDYFLCDPMGAGDSKWIQRWDEKLLKFISRDDLDGFEELWTCGEEDYEGKEYDIESYPVEKRKAKVRLIYFRLLHPLYLEEKTKNVLQKYLRDHTKGKEESEAWDIIKGEHADEIAYYQEFANAGGITENNFDELLNDMESANAQIKGYLLKYKEEHFKQKDAFASFELDW